MTRTCNRWIRAAMLQSVTLLPADPNVGVQTWGRRKHFSFFFLFQILIVIAMIGDRYISEGKYVQNAFKIKGLEKKNIKLGDYYNKVLP